MKKIIIISIILLGMAIPILILSIGGSYTPKEEIQSAISQPIKPATLSTKESVAKDRLQKEGIVTMDEWRNQTPGLLLKEAERITWSEFLKRYQNKKFHLIIRDLNKK